MLRKLILSLIINGSSLYALTQIIPDEVSATGGVTVFVLGAIIIGLLNVLIKPLIKIISFPFVFITGGLFLIVINGFMLWLLSYVLEVISFQDASFTIQTLKGYLYAAIIVGLINWVEQWLFKAK